jgi:hypothetical protein
MGLGEMIKVVEVTHSYGRPYSQVADIVLETINSKTVPVHISNLREFMDECMVGYDQDVYLANVPLSRSVPVINSEGNRTDTISIDMLVREPHSKSRSAFRPHIGSYRLGIDGEEKNVVAVTDDYVFLSDIQNLKDSFPGIYAIRMTDLHFYIRNHLTGVPRDSQMYKLVLKTTNDIGYAQTT